MADAKWVTWTLVAMLGWGLWGAFAAEAEKRGASALGVTAGVALVEAMVFIPMWPQLSKSASWWMLATGVAGGVAYLALFLALRSGGPPAGVIGVTSAYPIITMLVGALALGHTLTALQITGIVVTVAGVMLISVGG